MKDNRAGVSILATIAGICAILDWYFNTSHLFLLIGMVIMFIALLKRHNLVSILTLKTKNRLYK